MKKDRFIKTVLIERFLHPDDIEKLTVLFADISKTAAFDKSVFLVEIDTAFVL